MVLHRSWVRVVLLLLPLSLVSYGGESADDLGFGYTRKGGRIYFKDTRIDQPTQDTITGFSQALRTPLKVCRAPDADTFEALSEEYTRDKNNVYYKWISPGRFLVIELPKADVKSFKALNLHHAVDKNTIWYMDRPIGGSDPTTVEVLEYSVIKDAQRVYISGRAQTHLDAATFSALGSAYYVDVKGVYWGSELIPQADAPTFRVLEKSFVAVDKNSVYRSGVRQPHLDAVTCKLILHDPYGYQVLSDRNGVYLNNQKILHADPKDFTMIDNRTVCGGHYVFLVDTYHCTPVTLFREKERLVAETILYQKENASGPAVARAMVRAEVKEKVVDQVYLSPAPGRKEIGEVPNWQLDVLGRPDLVERMNEAAKQLK